MCQINDNGCKAKYIYGYRIYEKTHGRWESFFRHEPMPKVNKRTKARQGKFHAFLSLSDAKDVLEIIHAKSIRIYRCVLSGNIRKGVWSDNYSVKTITGNYCTLKKVVR